VEYIVTRLEFAAPMGKEVVNIGIVKEMIIAAMVDFFRAIT